MAALGLALGGVISLAVGGLAILAGRRWGMVDRPDDDLKPHTGEPVPLGGLGLLIGLHVGMGVAGVFDPGLLAATGLIWAVGLVDDLKGLSPAFRLVSTALSGILLVSLTNLPPSGVPDFVWVLAVVVLVNAINLFDGLDALAGSVSLVAVASMAAFALAQGTSAWWPPLVLAAALAGFLVWNRPPARLYLGDNGAYLIGVVLTWAAMQAGTDAASDLVALALVGVPLLDLGVTVFRRLVSGAPIFAGDRDHTYDRLHQSGRSAGVVAMVFASAQMLWSSLLIAISVLVGDVSALLAAVGLAVATISGATLVLRRRQRA